MDVKEAVKTAKDYISDLYADERVTGVGLEEVKFEGHEFPRTWAVTVGFFRMFDADRPLSQIAAALQSDARRRVYKIVRINDDSGSVESVTHRAVGVEQ